MALLFIPEVCEHDDHNFLDLGSIELHIDIILFQLLMTTSHMLAGNDDDQIQISAHIEELPCGPEQQSGHALSDMHHVCVCCPAEGNQTSQTSPQSVSLEMLAMASAVTCAQLLVLQADSENSPSRCLVGSSTLFTTALQANTSFVVLWVQLQTLAKAPCPISLVSR